MKITQLDDVVIDTNAPVPKVLSSDSELFVIFYSPQELIDNEIRQRNSVDDRGVSVLRFSRVLSYKFGFPNDEVFSGHPYYKYGLKLYKAQCIEGSSWVNNLIDINSIHPYHNSEKFNSYRHYLLSFRDNTFECLAQGYEIKHYNQSMFDVGLSVLQELFVREF